MSAPFITTHGNFQASGTSWTGSLSLPLSYRFREIRKTVTVAGEPDSPPSYGVPTIQDGIAIPYICGQQRIFNPIVCWYGNLTPIIEVKKELTSSTVEEINNFDGPDFGKKEKVTTDTITVTTSIIGWKLDVQMALCLGPGVELLGVLLDEEPLSSGPKGSSAEKKDVPAPYDKLTFHNGNFDQPRDKNLIKWCGAKVPAYVGIAYVVIEGLNVTDSFPSLSFEVRRRPNPLELSDDVNLLGNDINAATAVYDWLTNNWGGVGLSPKDVDISSFVSSAIRARDERNASSIFVQQGTSGSNVLKEYEKHLRSNVFFNPETGLVEMSLLRSPEAPPFELNQDNLVDKPKLSKPSWEILPNKLPITFTNRKKSYEAGSFSIDMPVDEEDPKKILGLGFPLAHTYGVAQRLAVRDAPYLTQPVWEIRAEATREASHLRPGDSVVFRWPDYRLEGVIGVVMSRNEDHKEGTIGLLISPVLGPQEGFLVDEEITQMQSVAIHTRPVAPQNFWAISAPYWMVYRSGITMDPDSHIDFDVPLYVVRSGGPAQRKYDIYQENSYLAPDEWARRDRNRSFAIVGKLVSNIGSYDGWETGILPEIHLKGVPKEDHILSAGIQGVRQGQSFLVIGDEVLAFEEAVRTGDTTWTLTNVHRALFGRAFRSHLANDQVAVLSNDWGYMGKTSYGDYEAPRLKAVSWGMTDQEDPITGGLTIQNEWVPSDQLNAPYRPDNTRVQLQRSLTPVEIIRGEEFDFEFSIRNRTSLREVPLMMDPGHLKESDGTESAINRVILLDSDNIEHVLLETSSGGYHQVLLPIEVALGVGYIWVQVTYDLVDSVYQDRVPVNVVEA